MSCKVNREELQKFKVELLLKAYEGKILEANKHIYLEFKIRQAVKILELAKEIFGNEIAVAFSGGKDSLVVLHLALKVLGSNVKVIYNSTTVEFPETENYVKELAECWGLNLIVAKSKKSFFREVKEKGWATHSNRWCCKVFKNEPTYEVMNRLGIIAEVTGTVRTESIYRRSLKPFMMPRKKPFIIRIHPIYDWNTWEAWEYIKRNNLPYNPLYDMGYRRIGCWCCPLNGITHYIRLMRTHPNLYSFLLKFRPMHPMVSKLKYKQC